MALSAPRRPLASIAQGLIRGHHSGSPQRNINKISGTNHTPATTLQNNNNNFSELRHKLLPW